MKEIKMGKFIPIKLSEIEKLAPYTREIISNIDDKELQIKILKKALENACEELEDCCCLLYSCHGDDYVNEYFTTNGCVLNSEYFINCATKEIGG